MIVVLLVACSVQGGQAIEVSFSAENGGEEVGVSSSYDVDSDISVSESSTASFENTPRIENSRQISGTGDANTTQSCTGNTYTSRSTYDASDASTSFSSSATLLPQSLSASQVAGASGGNADSSISVTHGGATASISSGMTDGAMSSSQSIWTGSAHASQSISAAGEEVRFGGSAASGGRQGYLGAKTKNYDGTLLSTATNDYADVAEVGELSGGYTVEGIIGGVHRSVTTVTGTWLRDMRATDSDNVDDTNDRTGGLEGFNHILQTIIDETPDGGTAIFPVGALEEDLNIWKNVQIIVELGGQMITNSITLTNSAQLLSGSTGLFSPTVTVNEGSSINHGLSLASDNGAVTVTPGTYTDIVTQNFYPHDITLIGEAGALTSEIILDQYLNGLITGLKASLVQVNSGASINEGLSLTDNSGLVSVTAGEYNDVVNQNFYSQGIQLTGDGNANTLGIVLDQEVNGEIASLTASTVQVNSGALIQDGVDLAKVTGTVNVADDVADGQDVDYYKHVTLNGNTINLGTLTLNCYVNGLINDLTASTVQVNKDALIQDGVDLAKVTGMVNVADDVADGQNVNYNKEVTMNGNDINLNRLTLNRYVNGLIDDLTASNVQVNSAGCINEGIGLAKDSGSINVAAGTYSDDVIQSSIYSRDLTLTGNDGAVTKSITLDKDVNGKISGLRATTLNVNSGASIQDGITLAKTSGTVSVASGAGTGQTVNYNKDVYLAGLGSDVLNTLTLSLNGVGKISGFTTGTVNVGALAKIQQGIDLATATGTVNLATSHDYGETVNYNKAVTINGNGAATSDLTLSVDGTGKIGSFTASTVNVGTLAKVQQGINLAASSGTVNVAAGAYSENVVLNKALKLVGSGATATSFALNSGASLLTGSTGITTSAVTVNSGAKIQDGITLASSGGTVNVASGAGTGQTVDYNKAVSLIGSDLLNTLTLSTSTQGITGLTASTVNVGSTASINYGLSRAANNGAVNVAAGTYSDDITQSFYSRGITLTGATGAVAKSITLDQAVNGKISGLTASTANVGSGALIQDGVTLAASSGTVNVAAGTYSENVVLNKALKLVSSGATTTSFTLNSGASLLSGTTGVTSSAVTVNSGASVQGGITLATLGGTVNVASGAGTGQTVDYNKNVYLTGSGSNVLNALTLSLDGTGKISGFAANTVNVASTNAKIQQGIDLAASGGTVNVAAGTYYENLNINKALTLNGAGSDQTTVDGQDLGSVITVGAGATNNLISNIKVTNGYAAQGGGISNQGSLTLQNVEVSNNNAGYGGGVINTNGGSLTLVDVNIHHNDATGMGGGVYNDKSTSVLTMTSGSITYNTASDGAGICNGGTLNLNGGSIAHNTASSRGGGIGNWVTLALNGATITDNKALVSGGGIFSQSGTVTLISGSVTGNVAPIGSGIAYIEGSVTGDNGLVTGNTGSSSQIQHY